MPRARVFVYTNRPNERLTQYEKQPNNPYKFKVGDTVEYEGSTASGKVIARYRDKSGHCISNLYSILFLKMPIGISVPGFNFYWTGNTVQIVEHHLTKYV